jgi:RNA polymerase-binding transcription factor DksA
VRRALEKFDDGTYGICDRCGAAIPDERLEARPSSVRCVRCSAAES